MTMSLHENYAKAGFLVRLPAGHTPALLVIDFVDAYLLQSSPLYAGGIERVWKAGIAAAKSTMSCMARRWPPIRS